MAKKRSYVKAAFSARPFGMPVPPNWLALTAFGLLGGFVNPGFWLVGLGLEIAYLWGLSRHPRFRAVVDAGDRPAGSEKYDALLQRIDGVARERQQQLEARCADIVRQLQTGGAIEAQLASLTQLCWLHLRLLVARGALVSVVRSAGQEHAELMDQRTRCETRLLDESLDASLRRSLEQQLAVIRERLEAHGDAERRLELVNAELERIRQQVALVYEQSMLATDAEGITRSIDVLAASLNAAGDLLQDQQAMFSDLDDLTSPPPPIVLSPGGRRSSTRGRPMEER
jgi:hypothetical protein